jgi:hypothetical protein
MHAVMTWQSTLCKGVFVVGLVLATELVGVRTASAQALLLERLPGGTELVLVSLPLADATTLAWPTQEEDEPAMQLLSGRLTLAADVEDAFADPEGEAAAPPVIVAVGGASPGELAGLLTRVLSGRPLYETATPRLPRPVEGGLDRRLGAPGSDAQLRLEVPLPPPDDPRRSAVEVLWDLVPELLADAAPFLAGRVEGDLGVLEARVEADLGELTIHELRLGLVRFASDPTLQVDAVEAAARRLSVGRQAMLEAHPDGALKVLARWSAGGEEAVREFLFGLDAVTVDGVRDAAATWLAHHPGRAQLVLPPAVFNPRFARGPEIIRLGNDLTVAVLERSGAPLAVVCLRPVMVPDLDGSVTATVLARIARQLRSGAERPGWVRVRNAPPMLEVAASADDLGELLEQVASATSEVADDRLPAAATNDDARRRALALMAARLGLAGDEQPSPAALLRPGNLALGVVAGDAEAALEAVHKFWSIASIDTGAAVVHNVAAATRSRVAAAGDRSVLVVALELPFGGSEAVAMVVGEVLGERLRVNWPEASITVHRPFVPGRSLVLLEIEVEGTVAELEHAVAGAWRKITAAVDEARLAPIKRRVAAGSSAEMSGVAGHARRCAGAAAGAAAWRQPAELELEILTQDAQLVSEVLAELKDWSKLETTAAGELPIDEPHRP